MDAQRFLSLLKTVIPEASGAPSGATQGVLKYRIPASEISKAAQCLKSADFDLLSMVTAVDWPQEGRFELVYLFTKTSAPQESLLLSVDVNRDATPQVPSVTFLYPSADWQEREVYDLFGIQFEGHPRPKRILLWEGYPGFPLRKDYIHTPDKYDNGSEIGLQKPVGGAS